MSDSPEIDVQAAALAAAADTVRPLDGSNNNLDHPEWGAAGATLLRLTPPADEGPHATTPIRHRTIAADAPGNPRAISNAVCDEDGPPLADPDGRTHWMWAWGQFLDHQLDRTPEGGDEIVIEVAADDEHLSATQEATIHFQRSRPVAGTGVRHDRPREHPNVLSAYIDASGVYGVDAALLAELVDAATGKLRTSDDDLLPVNADGQFIAGDVRVNEHPVLMSMHTMFMRLHNLRVDHLVGQGVTDPTVLFAKARAWVGAVMQFVTYEEFLPALLGADALADYGGYRPDVETTISSEFSSAAYRLGHSMLPDSVPVGADVPQSFVDAQGVRRLSLRASFGQHQLVIDDGIEPFVGVLHTEAMRRVDPIIADGLRNNLFRGPDGPLLDLAALNILRGRDHRVAPYNDVREGLGLGRMADFDEMAFDANTAAALRKAYTIVDEVDLWVGGLCEAPEPGAVVGETLYTILVDQFTRLRDGDRWFWLNDDYPTFADGEPVLTADERAQISEWTLARVLIDTGSVTSLDANDTRPGVANMAAMNVFRS